MKHWKPLFIENSKIPVWLSYIAPIDIGAITLGPIVGKLVAKELTQNKELSILDGFRPGRFL